MNVSHGLNVVWVVELKKPSPIRGGQNGLELKDYEYTCQNTTDHEYNAVTLCRWSVWPP